MRFRSRSRSPNSIRRSSSRRTTNCTTRSSASSNPFRRSTELFGFVAPSNLCSCSFVDRSSSFFVYTSSSHSSRSVRACRSKKSEPSWRRWPPEQTDQRRPETRTNDADAIRAIASPSHTSLPQSASSSLLPLFPFLLPSGLYVLGPLVLFLDLGPLLFSNLGHFRRIFCQIFLGFFWLNQNNTRKEEVQLASPQARRCRHLRELSLKTRLRRLLFGKDGRAVVQGSFGRRGDRRRRAQEEKGRRGHPAQITHHNCKERTPAASQEESSSCWFVAIPSCICRFLPPPQHTRISTTTSSNPTYLQGVSGT